jgi:hypothetical protein
MSESFRGVMQNPTAVAMLGSTAIHGLLVITSVLSPAESQSVDRLRLVNLAPPSAPSTRSNPNPNAGLLVPNDLPPINVGEVPQLGPLPDITQFTTPNIPPSQSFYVGNSRSLTVGKLPITNPPQRSVPITQLPVYGTPNLGTSNFRTPNLGSSGFPNSGNLPNNGNSLIPPQSVLGPLAGTPPSIGSGPSGQPSSATQPNYSGYNVSRNPSLPQLSGEPLRNSDLVNLYARPSAGTASEPVENPEANPVNPGAVTPETRDSFKKLLQERSAAIGQPLSAQTGPRLTAAYPASACPTKQDGLAIISAVYAPNGALATDFESIQVVQSAATLALNQAAIAAVKAYPQPPAAGIYQAFNYTVDIPYSAAVCGKSAAPTKPVQPSSSPSLLPIAPKPTKIPLPSPSPALRSSPKSPSAFPSPDFIPPNETPPASKPDPSASVAPPRPQPSSVETAPPSGDLEPLPSPSIAVPETP